MSDSSRSRRKHKLEPISLEELANTTGMSGFVSFLTRDPSVPVPVLDTLGAAAEAAGAAPASAPEKSALGTDPPEATALESSALESMGTLEKTGWATVGEPQSGALERSALEIRADELSALELATAAQHADGSPENPSHREIGALFLTAPEATEVETSALVYPGPRRQKIREAATVQDGHSLGEQAVYDAMYRAGKPYQGESRILTIGLRTLAELARMTYPNCKANVRALAAKLAIDESSGFSYTEGRTYVVYSFREILRRRKAAGLTHVVRTRGVIFVDPVTGEPVKTGALDSNAPDPAGSGKSSAPVPAKASAPVADEKSALATGAHIRNRHFHNNYTESSSAEIAAVAQALRRYGPADDAGAHELIHLCRLQAPDAGTDEIIELIRQKTGTANIRGSVLGFLKVALPRCFVGESFRLFREERRKIAAREQLRNAGLAREILADTQSDLASVEWAEEVLRSLP